jgi:hypothetical protein
MLHFYRTIDISVLALKGLLIITRGSAPGLKLSPLFRSRSPSSHPSISMGARRVREVINGVFPPGALLRAVLSSPFRAAIQIN